MSSTFQQNIIVPFLSCLEKFADRNAFLIEDKYYTYKEFANIISQIQQTIHEMPQVGPNVGLVPNDDIFTYASIFAIWFEGRAYVPLHPNWPSDRVNDIIKQVNIDCILDSSEKTRYDENIVINTKKLIYQPSAIQINTYSDEELAYILFTSGSTGKPKGVQLSKANVASFMESLFKTVITMDENDRCLQPFDLTFDLSVMSYLAPLVKGACCYPVPSNQIKYSYIAGLIEDYQLTVALMAPSTIRYLKPYFDEIDASSLRFSLFCGEALHEDITMDWSKCAKNAIIKNVYGPTEDTIFCSEYTFNRVGGNKSHNGVLSIGKPMANDLMVVINEEKEFLSPGETGELCLSGAQLSPGYWNNEGKNKEAFFFIGGERWYHTGDICYIDDEGDIMYVGRLDGQAKIQGFRVELGEIEFHAKTFLGVTCVALAFSGKDQLTEIALFVEKAEESPSRLIAYMRTKMPVYMIPSRTIYLPNFPLNANGKIDKNELRKHISEQVV